TRAAIDRPVPVELHHAARFRVDQDVRLQRRPRPVRLPDTPGGRAALPHPQGRVRPPRSRIRDGRSGGRLCDSGHARYAGGKQQGFHDVGFTEHFYAGLFGGKPVLESHARELNQNFPKKQAYVKLLGVPYYVGEFNVIYRAAGGERVMREYYDRMGAYGWTAT